MARCIMCDKERNSDNFEVQFIDLEGKEYSVCDKCSEAIASVSENDVDADNSIEYIRGCIKKCNDETLNDWLSEIVQNNIEEQNEADASDPKNTTFWISNLKAINRVVFWIIILIGVFLFFKTMDVSFGIALTILAVAIISALLIVGLSMVFLDLANDIHRIRNILEKNNRK